MQLISASTRSWARRIIQAFLFPVALVYWFRSLARSVRLPQAPDNIPGYLEAKERGGLPHITVWYPVYKETLCVLRKTMDSIRETMRQKAHGETRERRRFTSHDSSSMRQHLGLKKRVISNTVPSWIQTQWSRPIAYYTGLGNMANGKRRAYPTAHDVDGGQLLGEAYRSRLPIQRKLRNESLLCQPGEVESKITRGAR